MLSPEEQKQLQDMKPGDEVAVRRVVYGRWRWTLGTMDRLTAKHLVIGDEMFSKRTGKVRGYSSTHTRIAPLNIGYQQRIDADTAKVKEEHIRQECITTLDEGILWTLPTELLQGLASEVKRFLEKEGRRIPETLDEWQALGAERL